VLTPFDIRLAKELKIVIDDEMTRFREYITNCLTYDDVKFQLGYFNALDNVLTMVEDIERKITSGND
jgi:hypothetical protein